MNIKDRIRAYLTDSFLDGGQVSTLQDDDDLMEVLDSLQVLRLATDLEGQFGLHVDNSELTPENFGSVDRLAEYIARKQE